MSVNTAVVAVIFPDNLIYFKSFLNSLTNQNDQEFDLLLIVDSVETIEEYLHDFRSIKVVLLPVRGSIASNRQTALQWLTDLPYDYFIFADTDDMLMPDRVLVCKFYLHHAPVVVNDLYPFYDEKIITSDGYWRQRLPDGYKFTDQQILSSNFAGLGNTSIRKEVIKPLVIPERLIAIDWFIFYHYLQNNFGIFVHRGGVLYRQHKDNVAGIKMISENRLSHIVKVKIRHYLELQPEFPEVTVLLKKTERICERLLQEDGYSRSVTSYLNNSQINYFWWEETEYLNE
jgi:hypothetical protein